MNITGICSRLVKPYLSYFAKSGFVPSSPIAVHAEECIISNVWFI